MASLRETKKAQTRQRISDIATQMFATRGFEAVTIADIADAAGVSKVTVFNYFPRKEDLFFDRMPQIRDLFADAIATRGDRTALTAVQDLVIDLARQHHPVLGLHDRFVHFWRTIIASPALRARARELADELTDHLATHMATAIPPKGAPAARLQAALAVVVIREAFTAAAARMLAGEPAQAVDADYQQALASGFGHLQRLDSAPPGIT